MAKDKNLKGNERIEDALGVMYDNLCDENLSIVLSYIRERIKEDGHFVVAVDESMSMRTITLADKTSWFAAFTSVEEQLKGSDKVVSGFTAKISEIIDMVNRNDNISGVILNPWNNGLKIDRVIAGILLNGVKKEN